MQQDSGIITFVLRWLTVIVICATVAALPWMLGGVVPVASLVLLVGSIVAGTLSLLFQLISRHEGQDLPKLAIPLLGLALIGFWQLSPSSQLSATAFSDDFGQLLSVTDSSAGYQRSLSPSDTRTRLANTLSLALLSLAAFRVFRTGPTIAFGAFCIMLSGLTFSTIGLTLIFEEESFSWNEIWALGWTKRSGMRGFASFINPNSAGGWLCLTVAVTAGLTHWHLKRTATAPKLRRGRLRVSWIGRMTQQATEVLAELTVWQILTLAAVVFLAATVAATRSRGALLALAGAIVLTIAVRSSIKVLPFALAGVMIAGFFTYVFLQSFGLQEDVAKELETLQEYETAVGARPDHWWDAAHAFVNWPVLGAGQGSYRFAVLPFDSDYRNIWFRNADNQYVETLVEAGIAGLALFLAVGWIGVRVGVAAARQVKVRKQQKDPNEVKLSRRILAGLATAVTMAVFSQAIAASVDYGIAMPPASSLLVLIIAVLSGYLNSGPATESATHAGAFRFGKLGGLGVTLCTLIAAGLFLPDLWAATQVDEIVVAGHRPLTQPVNATELDDVSQHRADLMESLQKRPDDVEGLRLLSRLATAEFRWASLVSAAGEEVYGAKNLNQRWADWTLFRIASSVHQLEQQDAAAGKASRSQLMILMDAQQLPETLKLIQNQFPHLPGVPVSYAAVATIRQDAELFRKQVALSTAIDPSNSEKQFQLGGLALRLGEKDLASECWQRSLKYSNVFRAPILEDSAQFYDAAESMTLFGAETYLKSVEAASKSRNAELQKALWERAETQWQEIPQEATEPQAEARLNHLARTRRLDNIRPWLEATLKRFPDNLPLRVELAKQWEKEGKFIDALKQWERIRFQHPTYAPASKNIRRLNELE